MTPGPLRRAASLLLACAWLGVGAPVVGGAAPAAQDVTPAPAPKAPLGTLQERLATPITATFQEVEFVSAMEFLATSAGVNILLSEKAKQLAKPVTVHLVKMPLLHALAYLLKGQGLLYRLDEDAVWVATRDELEVEPMETRVFFLNQGPGLFPTFEPLSETREGVALQATPVKQMKTIKDTLEAVIPTVGESAILLDERSGALIVTHVPYYLQQVESLLSQLDVTPAQILIEARFIELTLTDTSEWGLEGQLTGDAALTKTVTKDGTSAPALQFSTLGTTFRRGSKTDFANFANQSSGLNLTLQGILSGTQYQHVLHALADNKRAKTLSAPRVTALNNQTATIKIVTEFIYATQYQASVVRQDLNGDGDFADVVNGVRETRFVNVPQGFVTKDLGILLHVTPSVGRDLRMITLALKPEVSEQKTNDTFGGEVSLPRFTSRNLETSVVIEDGQTVMLGGLMKDTTSKTQTRVPVLGSLPVLGRLFRRDEDSSERSNLVIFVTAQLMHPSGSRLAQGRVMP